MTQIEQADRVAAICIAVEAGLEGSTVQNVTKNLEWTMSCHIFRIEHGH